MKNLIWRPFIGLLLALVTLLPMKSRSDPGAKGVKIIITPCITPVPWGANHRAFVDNLVVGLDKNLVGYGPDNDPSQWKPLGQTYSLIANQEYTPDWSSWNGSCDVAPQFDGQQGNQLAFSFIATSSIPFSMVDDIYCEITTPFLNFSNTLGALGFRYSLQGVGYDTNGTPITMDAGNSTPVVKVIMLGMGQTFLVDSNDFGFPAENAMTNGLAFYQHLAPYFANVSYTLYGVTVSTNVLVLPEDPALAFEDNGDSTATLSWSTNLVGFILQKSQDLSYWTNVNVSTPLIIGDQNMVTVPMSYDHQYFRLKYYR